MGTAARSFDVVVVGGGSCGCVVASRLSANPDRRVLLLEEGPGYGTLDACPAQIRDIGVLPVGPESAWSTSYPAQLMPGREASVSRGRVLGGSGAVNGGYFVRAPESDFEHWPPSWSYESVLPYFRRLESDADFGGPRHGLSGPIPVRRRPPERLSRVSEAFTAAAVESGYREEPDKNNSGTGGIGPVPLNAAASMRMSTALTYLLPSLGRSNLTVETHVEVLRIVLLRNRVVGVEAVARGVRRLIRTESVVLAAGGIETPMLLMRSGIGPSDHLGQHGISTVVAAPGVGAGFSDHPEVTLAWRDRKPIVEEAGVPALEVALNVENIEIRPYTASFGDLIPGTAPCEPCVGVGLMRPESRGEIRLASSDRRTPPRIKYRYLESAADRRAMWDGIEVAADLLRRAEFDALLEPLAVRSSDEWLKRHLGTSLHLCGSCRMGPESDRGSVVDEHCRVHGVEGLSIADTSVMPVVPGRGPHATAVMIAERVSDFLTGA